MASDDEPASSQLSLNPLLTSLLLGTRASNALPHGAAFEYQTSFAAWARETCALSAHAATLLARLSRHLTAEAPAPLAGAENDEEAHAAFSHYSELVETLLERGADVEASLSRFHIQDCAAEEVHELSRYSLARHVL